jgi:hypothetical protein
MVTMRATHKLKRVGAEEWESWWFIKLCDNHYYYSLKGEKWSGPNQFEKGSLDKDYPLHSWELTKLATFKGNK